MESIPDPARVRAITLALVLAVQVVVAPSAIGAPEPTAAPAPTSASEPGSAPAPKVSPSTPEESSLPFYLGESLRYQNCNIFYRFGLDIVGTPIHFVHWDAQDWLVAGLTAGSTLALMAPTDPSPDAHLQYWLVEHQNKPLDYVFPRLTTERFSGFGIGIWGVSAAVGWIFDLPDIQEWASLFLETMGISQILHNAQKLMMGRESPEQGAGRGIVHGPSRGPDLWPGGTPSGHTISVFALATLTAKYFDNPWIDGLAYFSYAYISLSVVYNNQHFISDVVWGAPIGYFLGYWMAEHRSSRYTYIGDRPVRREPSSFVGIFPWTEASVGAQGLRAVWRW